MSRKSKINELGLGTEVQFLKMDGKRHGEISEILNQKYGADINRQAVSRYLRNTLDIEQEANARAAIRLEVNQENAVSELSSQLNEYTANYNAAMDRGDERAAAVWSRNRIDLLKEMLRVTGLYDKAKRGAEGDNEIIIKVDWI